MFATALKATLENGDGAQTLKVGVAFNIWGKFVPN